MAEEEPKPLAYVPETVLKKRKSNEEWAIKKRARLEEKQQRIKDGKKFIFKRAEQFVREYRDREMDLVRMKRRTKMGKPLHINSDAKLLFVIRIGGISEMHPQTRKALYQLKLRHIFEGVFVKINERKMHILRMVQPYVTYGYPNVKSIKDLVFKKGYGKVGKEKVPLTDNNIIEQALGKYNIISIGDIEHEIVTVGPHFFEVMTFLCPFKLNKPEDGVLKKKKAQFKDGGDTGNRGDEINELISKMN